MAIAIASNRVSNASIGRKILPPLSLPGQGRVGKQADRLNRNVAFDVALTGCPVMHCYSDSPMHLLSGVDIAASYSTADPLNAGIAGTVLQNTPWNSTGLPQTSNGVDRYVNDVGG